MFTRLSNSDFIARFLFYNVHEFSTRYSIEITFRKKDYCISCTAEDSEMMFDGLENI